MSENINEIQINEADSTEETGESTKASVSSKKKEGCIFTESLYEAVSVAISAIMIIAVVFTFGFRLVGVVGHSMDTTLNDGDWLFVTPYYTQPEYGDIVISTKKTAAENSIVKRVIAVAGDEVTVDEFDNVSVNGVFLSEDSYTIKNGIRHGNLSYPVIVPEGCVMLMGDNRCGSWDSRFTEIGFAEVDYLLGKAKFRIAKDFDIYGTFVNR